MNKNVKGSPKAMLLEEKKKPKVKVKLKSLEALNPFTIQGFGTFRTQAVGHPFALNFSSEKKYNDSLNEGKNRVSKRLDELANLSQGWYDGEQGEVIPKDSIIKFKKHFLDKELLYTLNKPYIYPTIEGGISIEWDFENPNKSHATLDVDMKTFEASLLLYSEDDGIDEAKTFEYNLKLKRDWFLLRLQFLTLIKTI